MSEDFPVSIEADFGTVLNNLIEYPKLQGKWIIVDDKSKEQWKEIVAHLKKAQKIHGDYQQHIDSL